MNKNPGFKRVDILITLILLFIGSNSIGQDLNFLFKGGEEGYACFRIPAMVTTDNGIILAFAEARKNSCGDAGDIDLVLKRSFDGGNTWTGLQLIWSDSTNTCGNPAPVIDKKTGRIILLASWNLGTDHEADIIANKSKDMRRIFVLSSGDEGETWSSPEEITTDVKQDNWTWYATGPGSGIQIQKGKYKGRLVVACDHVEAQTKKGFSHTIFSDDGGKKWQLGGTTPQDKVNESSVAQLPNGDLMLNMRNYSDVKYRQVSISKDGNKSWSDPKPDTTLIEPACQGSLIQYSFKKNKKWMAFSNPASKTSRVNMTVRFSKDGGKTWPLSKLLYEGPSAYSNLTQLKNGEIGCLFEAGYMSAYEGIVFRKVTIGDLGF
jgi:sialidase-1